MRNPSPRAPCRWKSGIRMGKAGALGTASRADRGDGRGRPEGRRPQREICHRARGGRGRRRRLHPCRPRRRSELRQSCRRGRPRSRMGPVGHEGGRTNVRRRLRKEQHPTSRGGAGRHEVRRLRRGAAAGAPMRFALLTGTGRGLGRPTCGSRFAGDPLRFSGRHGVGLGGASAVHIGSTASDAGAGRWEARASGIPDRDASRDSRRGTVGDPRAMLWRHPRTGPPPGP